MRKHFNTGIGKGQHVTYQYTFVQRKAVTNDNKKLGVCAYATIIIRMYIVTVLIINSVHSATFISSGAA